MRLNSVTSAIESPSASRRGRVLLALAGAALAIAIGVLGSQPADVPAATTATPINQIALNVTGSTSFTFDPSFMKLLKKSHGKLAVSHGAKLKGKTATLPINATTVFTVSPASVDVPSTGSVIFKRTGNRKVEVDDLDLSINSTGLPALNATVRGKPDQPFAGLTIAPTTAINQAGNGYQFIDVQLLVSNQLASAFKKAKIKNIKPGNLLGLMTMTVTANLPNISLPTIPGLTTGTIPGF